MKMTTKKKLKYIKANNLPPRIGILGMVVWWLLLDRVNAPGWFYGVVFTFLGIVYLAEVSRMFEADAVDLVGNEEGENNGG